MIAFLICSLLAVNLQISLAFIRGQPQSCPPGERIVAGERGFHCCKIIHFCEDSAYFCPSPGNHHCTKCAHNIDENKIAYKLSDDRKTCERLCSWRKEGMCFPGTCSDGMKSSCVCAPGFTNPENGCREVAPGKYIKSCTIKLSRIDSRSGQEVESQIIHCDPENKPKRIPIVMPVNYIHLELEAEFTSDLSKLSLPYYIKRYEVGFIGADLGVSLEKAGDRRGGYTGKTSCRSSYLITKEISCKAERDVRAGDGYNHGDRILITPSVTISGSIEVSDYEASSHVRIDRIPSFQGSSPIELLYDFLPPEHCSVRQTKCDDPLIDFGPPAKKLKRFDLKFPGWFDDSGIEEYEYEIYKMQPYGDQLGYADKDLFTKGILKADSNLQLAVVILKDPGAYCVQIMVKAYDGRYQRARRFFIFDNKSEVTINPNAKVIVRDSTSTLDASTYWQGNKRSVTLNVNGRFKNQEHIHSKYLNAIKQANLPIEQGYEERTGQPPHTRSMEAVESHDGIVEFKAACNKDHKGCRTLKTPPEMNSMGFREEFTLPINTEDGDCVKVWFQGLDVVGNMKEESVVIYIDSTGPQIDNFMLKRSYDTYYGVHQSEELHGLTFEFAVFDPESGLASLSWQLIDVFRHETIIGEGSLPIKKEEKNKCDIYTCACVDTINECYIIYNQVTLDSDKLTQHQGQHDFDYRIIVKATNQAGIETTERFKFTIDITAPEPGTVFDALPDGSDIDFQQGFTLHGSWDGFFDRESSILYYRYAVLNKCADKSILLGPNPPVKLLRTSQRYASIDVTEPGKYYFNVIGYNKGESPSDTGCSDGVVIDNTPPVIKDIIIKRALVKPGLIQTRAGHIWLINKNRQKIAISDPPESCRTNALTVEDSSSWPEGDKVDVTEEYCSFIGAASQTIYLPTDHELTLSWTGEDEQSGIYDFEVGLSSSADSLVPDLRPYTTTSGHSTFTDHHLNLHGGQIFYIFIKAVNRAQMTTIKVMGPMVIDLTPPEILERIKMTIKYKEVQHEGIILASWHHENILDPESGEYFHYEFAIGSKFGGTDIHSFTPADPHLEHQYCRKKHLGSCVAIPVNDLSWTLHDHQEYFILIKVFNAAGLASVVSSPSYFHYSLPPSPGHVFEINQNTYSNVELATASDDVDFQTDNHNVWVRWSGFAHLHEELTYKVGLGSKPKLDDIVAFQPVSGNHHYFSRINLETFKKYYVTVEAENKVGPVAVSSDGIMILPANPVELNFKVFDGPPCHTESVSSTCEEDFEFASSASVVDGHWEIPETIAQYFTHIEWAIERKEPSVNNWLMVRDFENVHASSFGHAAGLSFHNNDNLRIVVKFCHPDGCYQPVYSKGFWIITEPPLQEDFTLIHVKDEILTARWKPWKQSGLESLDTFSHYEWNILSFDGGLLVPWQRIKSQDIHLEDDQLLWKTEFHITHCARLGIRGYNKVGLYSTEHSRLPECYRKKETKNFVLDSIGEWDEKEKTLSKVAYDPFKGWLESDVDYTPSSTMISAVWPHLRHNNFYWKIVSDKAIRDWKHSTGSDSTLSFSTYSDSSPEVLASGHTTDRFINVEELTLQHGQRYYVCVYASTVRLTYSNNEEILEAVANCSDGVVVDLTPPLPGKVVAGINGKNYQSSTTDFLISWSPFVDVEEHGAIPHSTGIKSYYYAIGSYPGKRDVTKYTNAEYSNSIHVHGLELQGGLIYYASIKAVDFAGHHTIVHSAGVVVDVTPPIITDSKIVIGGLGRSSYQTTATISATWKNVFIDPESDISSYEWCVGTSPNYCDIMAFQQTILPEGYYGSNLNVYDGQTYYVSVKAYNHAGLSTITSSWSIIFDTSPPTCGTVIDGNKAESKIDVNYKVDVTSLSAHWEGFNDPHTPIVSYFVGIGTCPNCHNFLEFSDVGLQEEISWSGFKLALGQKYYITVKACNAAELCCTTSSDGVISDNTPPNAGLVFDGFEDEDLQWQYSRYFIAAHWINFHDVHSGLSHYEWRAGTVPGGEDIFRHKRIHLEERFFIVHLKKEMPISHYIHITVRAYNKVGLYCEKSSNGFRVDISPPDIRIPIEFDIRDAGAIYQNHQFWRSSLKVKWHFVDFESPIYKQYISVFTHQNSYLHFPTLQLPGSDRDYQFTNLKMNDGDRYIIRVIACNQANLCNHSDTEEMLIDGSPPKSGVFALATDRAIPLPYAIKDWMSYIGGYGGPSELKLAWLSFSDPHSEILFYIVGVGTSMYSLDLKQNFPIMINPRKDEELKTEDGYYIQTVSIKLEDPIITGHVIYVTIWAENRVGLTSVPLHASFVFEDVPGTRRSPLILVRNCQAHSCKGHCACAGESHLCPYLEKACNDVSGQPGYPQIRVLDVLNTHLDELKEVVYTPATCSLSAKWIYDKNVPGVKHPYHYDYTIGVDDEGPGSAFKSTEQIWFDNLWFEKVIVTPQRNPGQKDFLQPNRLYKFYVRAWFDQNTFAIYSSNGVKSDSTPPERSQLGRVRELSQQNLALDIDILTSSDQVSWSWVNAFKDDQSEITIYRISLSSFPGGEDTMHYQGNPQPEITLHKLNTLLSGVRYYLNVIAVNRAGLLSKVLSSNGFIIDKEPPVTGAVLDGIGLTDISHQNSSNVVAASWYGFYDLHSYIHHYLWCVGSTHGATDILPCVNVGLRQSSSQYIPEKRISHYFSSVFAVDGAGHKSNAAHSDGVIVDLTPPQSIKTFTFGPNLIHNPSFEQFTRGVPNYWELTGKGNQLISVNKPYLDIKGKISQRIPTESGHYYCITVYLAHPIKQKIESLGQITIPGFQKIFSLREKKGSIGFKGDDEVEWSPQVFYFVASEAASVITIESVGVTSSLFISSISVQHLQPIASGNTENTVYANLIIGYKYHALYSHWEIIDPESGIKEFLWAIGTVKGGTQLQGFKSVGTNSYAFNDSLILSHKSNVYVTIVAENNAGLRTVRYSNPLQVLLRPPEICCVTIGDGQENNYQKSFSIRVHWKVLDKDSDVTKCLLALGTKGNYQDIQRYTDVGITSPVSANLPNSLQHGTELYATIRCENSAGLSSQNISQAIIMVTSAPRSHNAVVLIGISSLSHYPTRDNHQPYDDSLDVSWSGFGDIHGIQNYEVRVADRSGRETVPWVSTRMPWITSIKLKGFHLAPNQPYHVFVRAINFAGLPSDAASATVTVEKSKPQIQSGRINSRWQGRDLELSWPGKFSSQSSLIYEVCIGSHPSGNDILRWTETKNTQIRLNNLNVTREYHVVITAINEAGLFTTENHVILR